MRSDLDYNWRQVGYFWHHPKLKEMRMRILVLVTWKSVLRFTVRKLTSPYTSHRSGYIDHPREPVSRDWLFVFPQPNWLTPSCLFIGSSYFPCGWPRFLLDLFSKLKRCKIPISGEHHARNQSYAAQITTSRTSRMPHKPLSATRFFRF